MTFLDRLRSSEPLVTVELRPPRRDQNDEKSIDSWFAMRSAIRRLAAQDTVVYLTDNAVGAQEEENLHHLITNLDPGVPRERICPFLTTKHPFEYCMLYAARAVEAGFPALTVLGGDRHVGPPRCVPHGYVLRQRIRERFPSLALGGWANPHRDASKQVDLVLGDDFTAEFFLMQVVHYAHLDKIEAFVKEAERRNVELPGIAGVFYYRSANPKTLEILSQFMPVPIEEVTREFESGMSAEEVCARTIKGLREVGMRHVYIANLPTGKAGEKLEKIMDLAKA